MDILVIDGAEVRQLLPMNECMDVMAETLKTLGQGAALNPLRTTMWLPERVGVVVLMPSYLGHVQAMGVKVISVMPGNEGTAYESHQGAVLVFEAEHGRLLAVVDASAITAMRTAAVSGVATRLLARADADDLAILGSGTQARTHLAAMLEAREIRRIRVWSRTPAHAESFAERESQRHGLAVEPVASAQAAVDGADLICTTTSASEPVLSGDWLAPGAHINAVGSSVPFARELDTAAVVKARLFVDRRESTINEAGDFLFPRQEGAIHDDHIQAEIGDLLLGQHPGRQSPDEITLFKSLGLAVEDLASAEYVYRKAVEAGLGASATLGGTRHD